MAVLTGLGLAVLTVLGLAVLTGLDLYLANVGFVPGFVAFVKSGTVFVSVCSEALVSFHDLASNFSVDPVVDSVGLLLINTFPPDGVLCCMLIY